MASEVERSRTLAAPPSAVVGKSRPRVLYAVLVLGLMLILCAPFFVDVIDRTAPQPQAGEVGFAAPLEAPVVLGGEWRLSWIGGGDMPAGTQARVRVPGPWAGMRTEDGRQLPDSGVARLELVVRGLAPGRYTLHVPMIYGANRVWVNGTLVGSKGAIGADPDATRYELRSHELNIVSDGSPLRLGIDVAAFHHRDTGIVDPPVFGPEEPMRRWIALEWVKDVIFLASLLLLSANSFIAWLFRRQDRASLFLALAGVSALPGMAILSYDNLVLLALPGLDFAALLALQYLGSTFAIMFLLAYTRALFPGETPARLFWAAEGVAGAFLIAQLASVGSTLAASRIAVLWPAVVGIAFAAMLVIVARAVMRNRDGAVVFLLGIGIFAFFFTNATIAWSGVVPPEYLLSTASMPLGMLMLLFSHFVIIAERWSLAIVNAERMNDDLRELIEVSSAITSEMRLEALLARIVEVTSRILNADRSSLLLYDERKQELWSLVAEGVETREIRFDSRLGLAGEAFTTGQIVNVPDAYQDPRFNRAIDLATGYKTGSILTMPVTARDGRKLGVMQALNRRDGAPFSEADEQRMAAFAAQAAIAIDNATLFAEVVASRNYNESILRSMSAGVVTLDRDAEAAKLNLAAERILGYDGVDGAHARTMLARSNRRLMAEIEAVAKTGEPKLLLDVDVRTGRGDTISCNINIVPLLSDHGRVGTLMLIEDISEGKRLQGAMRRFMTQKVVDQVLERGDELLFGTACEASILFADIRNFTSMAEALSPRETVNMLNEAFTDFFEAVSAADGVLDKFIGDAMMAVYGAPISTGRDARNAVESGVQMLRMLAELNQRREARGLPSLRLGIGIATGEVVAGTIGSPKRMDYTVIGDSVNLAARLQDLTKSYGVEMLVDEATAAAVAGTQTLRELDLIMVRGRQRPAKLFQVIPANGDMRALLEAYAKGRERFTARDWQGAAAAFEQALAQDPDDQPSRLMLERTQALAARPPAADWDGVWRAGEAYPLKAAE
jgi:adenylate cyclase